MSVKFTFSLCVLWLILSSSGFAIAAQDPEFFTPKTRVAELEAREQFYDAIEVWRKILRESPNSSSAHWGLARSYTRLGHYKEALDFVDKALLLANQNHRLNILKSRILMGLEQYDEALEILRSLKKNNTNYQIDLALAEIFAVRGDMASSARYLNAIKEFAHKDLNFLLSALMIYEEAGKLAEASRYLRQALDNHYDETIVHKVAAGYYLRRGRYNLVTEEIDIIKRLGLDTEELRLLGLEAVYLKGDYQLAINLAKTLLALYPENFKAWYILGLAYGNNMQMDLSLEALTTARRLEPDNELVKIVIAEMLRMRYPYPSEWHQREAAHYIASAEVKRKNLLYDESLHDYRFALQIDPLNKNNWMAFANVFRDRGQRAKYLDKLYAWRQFGVSGAKPLQELKLLLSIYEASQPQSVAQKWGLQQYSYDNNFYPLQVFVVQGQNYNYVEATRELGSYFVNILQWYEQPFVVGEVQIVDEHQRAQQLVEAEQRSDYYIILDLAKQGQDFRLAVNLYLSSTGRLLAQYSDEQIGNGNIYNSFAYLAKQLQAAFPKRSRVVQVKVNRAAISMGSLDGVVGGQKWLILPQEAVTQSVAKPFHEYDESKVIGTFTVQAVDEKVSEGQVQLRSFVRVVKKGQLALLLPAVAPTAKAEMPQKPNINLQNRLFKL